MSDESDATPHETIEDAASTRVPRREALKGLGALAVSTTALAAVGCSADMMSEQADAPATAQSPTSASMTGAPSGGAPASTTASSAPTTSQAKPTATMASKSTSPSSTTSSASTAGSAPTTASAGGSGGAGATAPGPSGMAGSPAMATAGSPAGAGATMAAGAGGADAMAATTDLGSLACILSPAMTEGPFFVDEELKRSDLVMGETDDTIVKAVPLALTIGIYKVNGMTCTPMPGLQVDIWHANAHGIYSDVRSGFIQSTDTQGTKFLRGYQITDEAGLVQFATIYPGWYPSRTLHIHLKIRMPMGGNAAYDFTSQMFFDEDVTKDVLSLAPYSSTPGTRMVFNDDDHIFNGTAANGQKPAAGQMAPGLQTMLALNKKASGFVGQLKVGLQM